MSSNPTRYQNWRDPILNESVGFSPAPEPDPDPSDPTDYASTDQGGAVQVGVDVGSPGLVQDKTAHTSGISASISATFDDAPEVGDTLIAVLINRNISTTPTTPTGWTRHPAETTSQAGDGGRLSFFYKVAQPGESSTVTISCGDAKDLYIAEWSGLGGAMADSGVGWSERINAGATSSMSTISITPVSSRGVLFAGFVQASRNPTLTLGSFTDVFNVDTDASGPAGALGYQITDPFSGSYSETCGSSQSDTYGAIMVGFAAATDDTVWFPGPAANDGDTATSAFSDSSGACLRVALEVERLIYRIALDIGQESAGVTVYELYGTDDATFASTTLLATLTFTATGSFTLDTVDVSWVPTATYLYYQLEHVSGGGSDREFYEIHLYSAVDVGSGVTSHPALTDRDDPEQHPADAIELDPAVDGETDVQSGMENHETRIDALEAAGDATALAFDDLTDVQAPDPVDSQLVRYDGLLAQYINTSGVRISQDAAGTPSVGSPVSVTNNSAYNAFPGLARMATGEFIGVYRAGTDHQSTTDGKIVGKISADEGATWGTAFDIYNPATLDARDPEVETLASGRVMVSFCQWNGASAEDVYVTWSDDDGSTWNTPVAVGSSFSREIAVAKVVELPGGGLVLPLYGNNGSGDFAAYLMRSEDQGATWGTQTTIAAGSSHSWTEPQIIRLGDGTLHCLIRVNDIDEIWRTTSDDDGATWSAAATAFAGDGKPAHAQLGNGALFAVFRPAANSDAVYRYSWDLGVTWSSATVLDTAGVNSEYASVLAIPVGAAVLYAIENSSTDSDVKFVDVTLTRSSDELGFYGATPAPKPTISGTRSAVPALADLLTEGATLGLWTDSTTEGTGGGSPTGAAGGDLSGTYPNPDVVNDSHTHSTATLPSTFVGPILISDTPSTPLIFADLIQNEAQDDLVYADL